ncbi:MAG: hypothetical protein ACJ75J_08615 [Cytophagaceae bacterium]
MLSAFSTLPLSGKIFSPSTTDNYFKELYVTLSGFEPEILLRGRVALNALPYFTSIERYFGASAKPIRYCAQL